MKQKENPLLSLFFNIVIPVIILNKGHSLLNDPSGIITLIVALAFPVIYGTYDLVQHKRKNFIAAFGVLNVLMTGGLALLKMDGIWFAVKEASFPLLLGVFILISAYTKTPFFTYLINQSSWLKREITAPYIEASQFKLNILLKQSTILFSISFFISSLLNFILALYIFSPIDTTLSEVNKMIILNQKIADMTWISLLVIGLPMTMIAAWIFWRFLKKLSQITQQPIEQILDRAQKKHD